MNNVNKSYYTKNSEEFIEGTIHVDMSKQYELFEKYLKPNSKILDIGFGSGRDSLYFQSIGHDVTSIDPTLIFCEKAIELGLHNVLNIAAEDMVFQNEFDGIWACASLLHVKRNDLVNVLKKCFDALVNDGTMYASFKLGDFEGVRDGRFYVDMNIDNLKQLTSAANLEIIEYAISEDVRKDHSEKWLNIIIKKHR